MRGDPGAPGSPPADEVEVVVDTESIVELSTEFAALGAELHGDGDNQAALERMIELAVKHIDGCNWASITVLRRGKGHTLVASDPVALQADALQYELDEGPCVSSAKDDQNYLLVDTAADARWPRYAAQLQHQTPVRSMYALRLVAKDFSALNLFSDRPGGFTDESIDTATILAAHASSLVALHEAEDQASNLETALGSSRDIGTALGVLMARRKITQDQAFDQLRVASQNLHRKLRDVADVVVQTGELPPHESPALPPAGEAPRAQGAG